MVIVISHLKDIIIQLKVELLKPVILIVLWTPVYDR